MGAALPAVTDNKEATLKFEIYIFDSELVFNIIVEYIGTTDHYEAIVFAPMCVFANSDHTKVADQR